MLGYIHYYITKVKLFYSFKFKVIKMHKQRLVINILVIATFVFMAFCHYKNMLSVNANDNDIQVYAKLKFNKNKIKEEYEALLISKHYKVSSYVFQLAQKIQLILFKQNPHVIDIYFYTVTMFFFLKWMCIILSNSLDIFIIINCLFVLNELHSVYEIFSLNRDNIILIVISHLMFVLMLSMFIGYSIYRRQMNLKKIN